MMIKIDATIIILDIFPYKRVQHTLSLKQGWFPSIELGVPCLVASYSFLEHIKICLRLKI